jgi:hypothetical protein
MVRGVHPGLHLEHEGAERAVQREGGTDHGLPRQGRAMFDERVEEGVHPEVATAEATARRGRRSEGLLVMVRTVASSARPLELGTHRGTLARSACSGAERSSGAMRAPPAVWGCTARTPRSPGRLSRGSPPRCHGQVRGVGREPVRSAISSISSWGSRPAGPLVLHRDDRDARCLQTRNNSSSGAPGPGSVDSMTARPRRPTPGRCHRVKSAVGTGVSSRFRNVSR